MKQAVTLLLCGFTTVLFSQTSFAIMDDGFALKNRSAQKTATKVKVKKSVTSKNSKKMLANSNSKQESVVRKSIKAVKRSLGAVPLHIQKNWSSLNSDQKEIVYSYHNENPYAEINKKHFVDIAKNKNKKQKQHDTAFGFDSNQQGSLDELRNDINGETVTELSDETKVIIDALAAIEDNH